MTADAQTATIERLRRATGRIDKAAKDRTTARAYDRIVPVFERMVRANQITHAERDAGDRYAFFYHGSHRSVGISGYGDQRWNGTSPGQQAECLTREEWPILCARELQDARHAIRDGNMIGALDAVVAADSTLEDVGQAWRQFGCKAQARSAGLVIVAFALGRLSVHYGFARQKVP